MRQAIRPGSLYRLIYCSRQSLPGDAETEVASIVDRASRNNRESDITGALLVTGSGFAQVLEGRREAVERTFERISADPRHTEVSILSFIPAVKRGFPLTPMALCRFNQPADRDPLMDILMDDGRSRRRAFTGSDVLRLIESLIRQQPAEVSA